MVTLTAECNQYKGKGQYIARITGRHSKFTYARDFIGQKDGQTTRAYVDAPGLFEEADIDKKGKKTVTYRAIVPRPPEFPPLSDTADLEFMAFRVEPSDAYVLAGALDKGYGVETMLRPVLSTTRPGTYTYAIGKAPRTMATPTATAAPTAAPTAEELVRVLYRACKVITVMAGVREFLNQYNPMALAQLQAAVGEVEYAAAALALWEDREEDRAEDKGEVK